MLLASNYHSLFSVWKENNSILEHLLNQSNQPTNQNTSKQTHHPTNHPPTNRNSQIQWILETIKSRRIFCQARRNTKNYRFTMMPVMMIFHSIDSVQVKKSTRIYPNCFPSFSHLASFRIIFKKIFLKWQKNRNPIYLLTIHKYN